MDVERVSYMLFVFIKKDTTKKVKYMCVTS
jgi:hypothetical protein